jgi:hypothetical protein
MRRDADWFGEEEVELVQLSRKLREAKTVEAVLDEAGIDYAVEPDRYAATFLFVFPTERVGAFFYVKPQDAERAREVLRGRKLMVMETLPE